MIWSARLLRPEGTSLAPIRRVTARIMAGLRGSGPGRRPARRLPSGRVGPWNDKSAQARRTRTILEYSNIVDGELRKEEWIIILEYQDRRTNGRCGTSPPSMAVHRSSRKAMSSLGSGSDGRMPAEPESLRMFGAAVSDGTIGWCRTTLLFLVVVVLAQPGAAGRWTAIRGDRRGIAVGFRSRPASMAEELGVCDPAAVGGRLWPPRRDAR